MHIRAIPPQFCLIRKGSKTLVLNKELSDPLIQIGVEDPWKWVDSKDRRVKFYEGRTKAAGIHIPLNGGMQVVLRRYHHGGLLGRLQKDLYLFSFPPLREMMASYHAKQHGIPTPEILGAVQRRAKKIFYQVDLLMKHLPEGSDLVDYFKKTYSSAQWKEKKEIIQGVGRLIRKMHDAGLYHADLHLKNIYMSREKGQKEFYLLDFDKAHVIPKLSFELRQKNLLRFHRYIEKYFPGFFTKTDQLVFLEAYLGNRTESNQFIRQHGRLFLRHVKQHRLLWPKRFTLDWMIYICAKGMASFFAILPEKMAYRLGGFLGRIAYQIDWKHRHSITENLKLVYKEKYTEKERLAFAKRQFIQLAYLGIEVLRSLRMNQKKRAEFFNRQEVIGMEHAFNSAKAGKGVLLLVSHFGNWELMSFIAQKAKVPLYALAKPLKNKWMDDWINRVRCYNGIQVIPAGRLNRKILEVLSQKAAVAMLIDQNAGRRGEMIPFLGIPAPTNTAPAYFALKSGATVMPVYSIRKKPGHFKIIMQPPLQLIHKSDFKESVRANTILFTQNLETMFHQYPEQWFWIHNRWKQRKRKS